MTINGQEITKGFNVNDKDQPFTEQILDLMKILETRNSNSLKSLVGQRVAIIRTGCGKAKIVGLVDITGWIEYNTEEAFQKDEWMHLVKAGSKYDIKPEKKKYAYVLENVERCDPITVTSKGIVIRNI